MPGACRLAGPNEPPAHHKWKVATLNADLVAPRRAGGEERSDSTTVPLAGDIANHLDVALQHEVSWTLFATIFAHSPIPIIISRLADGRYLEANAAALQLFNYVREDVIGRTALELAIWPSYADRVAMVESLQRHGCVSRLDVRLRRRDGTMVDVIYSARLVELVKETCVVSTIQDVTEKKRAEEVQRQLENRFAKVFRHSPYPIGLSRLADGVYLDVNEAWTDLTGYRLGEVLGKSTLELGIWVNPHQRVQAVTKLEWHGSFRDFPFQLRRKDGSIVEAQLSAAVIEWGGHKCLLAMSVDVTERKRADEQLRLSEQRFADVLDAAGEFVWEIDSQDQFSFVSPRVQTIMGFSPAEMIGRTPASFMPPEEAERVRLWLRTTREEGSAIRNLEHRSTTKDGRSIWLQISGVPVRAPNGQSVGMRGTGLDITERRRAAQLIEELATLDSLTHLPNRRLLMDRLAQCLLAARRKQTMFAVLFIDLDRFKTINDSLGHAVGDALLKEVAVRLASLVRRGDTLARLGGDEFVVVLTDVGSADSAGKVAQKIIAALAAPYHLDGQVLSNSASVGISLYPDDAADSELLLRHADMAMYCAKQKGRHQYQFFASEMNARAVQRLAEENRLQGLAAPPEVACN
jgi:diguanylate cyclase (GGDEF)-like protein/PAS domain S-box-containing protein